MSDKTPVQADGGGAAQGKQPQSRPGGTGESGGGAYPNPHDKPGRNDPGSFMGHGGQSEIDYSGPDNPNETTEDED